MKQAIALFSCLVLLMNSSPCLGEASPTCDEENSVSWNMNTDADHGASDDCSASCSCACCNIPLPSMSIQIHQPSSHHIQFNDNRELLRKTNRSYRIWQPPKI